MYEGLSLFFSPPPLWGEWGSVTYYTGMAVFMEARGQPQHLVQKHRTPPVRDLSIGLELTNKFRLVGQ